MGEQPNRLDESHDEEHQRLRDLAVHHHDAIRDLQRRIRELEQHMHDHEVRQPPPRRGFSRGRRRP